MEEKKIRLLKASEIECRIGIIKENGLSLLLYKDARADMKILDEVYGPSNWKRKHEMVGNSLYCTVSIWDEDKGQWISKSDVGTESYTEKEKGQASDSFKRACVSIGIGRELYAAPFVWVSSDKAKIQPNNGKYYCNERFKVTKIGYNRDREIEELTIINANTGAVVYELVSAGQKKTSKSKAAESKTDRITSEQLVRFNEELARTGVPMSTVRERFPMGEPEEMSEELYRRVMGVLAKTKSKAA